METLNLTKKLFTLFMITISLSVIMLIAILLDLKVIGTLLSLILGISVAIFYNSLQDMELKQRMHHISKTLGLFLPQKYVNINFV